MFVGPVVLDKCIQFYDPRFNRSREIPPDAIGGGIFDSFFRYSFVDNDAISGVAVDNIGVDICVKFVDSRSNGFRDIRGAEFEIEILTHIPTHLLYTHIIGLYCTV